MMDIKKYFWDLNPKALKETERIVKNPEDPRFTERFFELLSRCDDPKKIFSIITKKQFVEIWPNIRRYWSKRPQARDFKAWWETVYEQLLKKQTKVKGIPAETFVKIGEIIRKRRLEKNLTQLDLASRTGLNQPDISSIESGKKNITLETLLRLCKVLDIDNIPLE